MPQSMLADVVAAGLNQYKAAAVDHGGSDGVTPGLRPSTTIHRCLLWLFNPGPTLWVEQLREAGAGGSAARSALQRIQGEWPKRVLAAQQAALEAVTAAGDWGLRASSTTCLTSGTVQPPASTLWMNHVGLDPLWSHTQLVCFILTLSLAVGAATVLAGALLQVLHAAVPKAATASDALLTLRDMVAGKRAWKGVWTADEVQTSSLPASLSFCLLSLMFGLLPQTHLPSQARAMLHWFRTVLIHASVCELCVLHHGVLSPRYCCPYVCKHVQLHARPQRAAPRLPQ